MAAWLPPHTILEKSNQNGIDTLKLRGLSDLTTKTYQIHYNVFKQFVKNKSITKELIQEYLLTHKSRRNNLAVLKALYPELTKEIKFPKT